MTWPRVDTVTGVFLCFTSPGPLMATDIIDSDMENILFLANLSAGLFPELAYTEVMEIRGMGEGLRNGDEGEAEGEEVLWLVTQRKSKWKGGHVSNLETTQTVQDN